MSPGGGAVRPMCQTDGSPTWRPWAPYGPSPSYSDTRIPFGVVRFNLAGTGRPPKCRQVLTRLLSSIAAAFLPFPPSPRHPYSLISVIITPARSPLSLEGFFTCFRSPSFSCHFP